MFLHRLFAVLLPLLGLGGVVAAERPHVVIILADDLGYSDIGCYGSEIPTPNIDALARGGLRFTQFYNSARCSPTRAALLTGLNPHQAGMGRLAGEKIGGKEGGSPAYLGHLNRECVTLAEVLRPLGYRTYLSGKWHLGMRDEEKWPLQRGFDRFYGILAGAASYLRPSGERGLTQDNQQLPPPSDGNYYMTDAFADQAVRYVQEHNSANPFFLYLAFNAPHWPLHARKEDIEKFVGKYQAGWDVRRSERLTRMKELGIMPRDLALTPRDPGARGWDSLDEQERTLLDYRMAVYAAQVHSLDAGVGRLVAALRERGQLDNTLIFFLSDNGGCAEPYTDKGGMDQGKINDPAIFGNVSYGTGWANMSNTPFRKFKSFLYEGGISTPLIVHWPAGLKTKPGALDSTPGYLPDIMATVVEASGAPYPKEFQGHAITPLEGRSLMPILSATPMPAPPRLICWEQYGFKAVREGDLKAVFITDKMYDKSGSNTWELYDIAKDRLEQHNLAKERPAELQELIAKWEAWAKRARVQDAPDTKGK